MYNVKKNINYMREVKVQLEILQFGIGEKFEAKKNTNCSTISRHKIMFVKEIRESKQFPSKS